jgi:streptogramin lyase
MRRTAFLTAAIASVLLGSSANAAVHFAGQHRAQQISRVSVRKALVRPLPPSVLRLSPNISYVGTVTSVSGLSVGIGAATYDNDDGHFYLLNCQNIYRLAPSGQTTVIASLNGCGSGIVWDHAAQLLFVTVPQSYEVLSVTTTGLVNVLAGGTNGTKDGKGSLAQFTSPTGVALDSVNDLLYVADNDRMRRIDTSGNVLTVGPIGAIKDGGFPSSYVLAYNTKTAQVGIVNNYRPGVIGVYSTTTATYSTLAGSCYPTAPGSQGCIQLQQDGTGPAALFALPTSIAYNATTNDFYVSDTLNYQIRSITPTGVVKTIAGNGRSASVDGVGEGAEFTAPEAMALNTKTGQLLVFDGFPNLRFVTTTGKMPPPIPHSFAMSVTPTVASGPMAIAAAPDGSLWFAENTANYLGRVSSTGRMTEYVLPGQIGMPFDVAPGSDGDIWFGDFQLDQNGNTTRTFTAHRLPNGQYVEFPLPENCGFRPEGFNALTATSNGNLWLGFCSVSVGFLTPADQFVLYPSASVGGIAIGLGTNVWVGESDEMVEYSSTGAPIAAFGNVPADAGAVIGANGDIWFLTNTMSAVGDFNPTTLSYTLYTLPTCNCNRDLGNLIAAPNGDLWFTEGQFPNDYLGAIGQMTEAGVYTEYPIFEARSTPSGIAFSASGKLWISDIGAEKVGYMR